MKFVILLFFISFNCFCQTDNIGSGQAISFDGVDDYIEIGNHHQDLTLLITASAWIKFDPSATNAFPVFVKQINIHISVQKEMLVLVYKDNGKGINGSEFGKGHGLSNINSRVRSMNGQMLSHSSNQGVFL